jgi:hypothetical protein
MDLVADSPSLRSLASALARWEFDVFDLADKSSSPLVIVGFSCLDTFATVNLDHRSLLSFLNEVASSYKTSVAYHNQLHGASVARSAFSMCKGLGLGKQLPELMQFTLVLSGLVHDVAHPGLTAPFLAKAGDELSLMYSDDSPLERMHLALAFRLMRKTENAFLDPEDFAMIKQPIVRAVLGTDMTRHGEQVERLNVLLDNLTYGGSSGSIPWYWPSKPPPGLNPAQQKEWAQKLLEEFTMEVFLHAADVATPAMPFDQFKRWNLLVQEEFHAQGDRELAEFGSIISVQDGYDRSVSPARLHKFTVGFVKFVVQPLYVKLAKASEIQVEGNPVQSVDMSDCLANLENNVKLLDETAPK